MKIDPSIDITGFVQKSGDTMDSGSTLNVVNLGITQAYGPISGESIHHRIDSNGVSDSQRDFTNTATGYSGDYYYNITNGQYEATYGFIPANSVYTSGVAIYHITNSLTGARWLIGRQDNDCVGIGLAFGVLPTAALHVKAGAAGAGLAPIKFTSGILQTTAESGTLEYDGKVLYHSDVDSTRQVVACQQFISNTANFTLANSNAAQAPFAAANDVLTLAAGTSYFFEGLIQITAMGGTSRTTATLFGGTATLTSISYWASIQTGAAQALGTTQSTKHCIVATAQVLNATVTTAASTIWYSGIVRVNAGGTFIPQIQWSANPTGTPVCNTDSWFRIYPIGTNTVAAVGNFS